jgi:hypothetical protein
MDFKTSINLKEIAEQLDFDFRAFIHKETRELIFVPNDELDYNIDLDPWEKELDKLEKNFLDYLEIEKWTSREAFEIMREFTLQINEPILQAKLIKALNSKNPFRNFKFEIDYSGLSRQKWFEFKDLNQQEFVRRQLKYLETK